MRAAPGARIGFGAGLASGDQGAQEIDEGVSPQPGVKTLVTYFDAGYGWLLGSDLGVLAGAYFGGLEASKHDQRDGGGIAVAYGQLSWQRQRHSLALGIDLGWNVFAASAGGDVRLGPLTATAYGRYGLPFRRPDPRPSDANLEAVRSFDAGASLRWHVFVLAYAYYAKSESYAELPWLIEGAIQSRTWHFVLFGIDTPLYTGELDPR